jgi:hypothetical protein
MEAFQRGDELKLDGNLPILSVAAGRTDLQWPSNFPMLGPTKWFENKGLCALRSSQVLPSFSKSTPTLILLKPFIRTEVKVTIYPSYEWIR